MNLNDLNDKKSIFWILQISGWIALGLIYLGLYYREYINDPKSMFGLFLTYLTGFLISFLLRCFYKRIHYQSRSIINLSIIVVISSIVAANFWYWLDIGLSIPLYETGWYNKNITLQRYMSSTYWHAFILGTWSALYFVIKLWIEWNLQKERTEKAIALAQSAQLQMLRYQLNPHFLFNSLNSIRALIDEDKKNAKAMITELSEFLRYSLISKNYSDVPLKQELEAVRHYFRIEKKRYEDKLEVKFDIDPVAEEYPVLSFLIHPLVENAVKYGMQTSPMPLKINLKALVINGTLQLEVCNSGKWVEPLPEMGNNPTGTGTGLDNIRQRLENAFPENHKLDIRKNETNVCIKIEINKDLKPAYE